MVGDIKRREENAGNNWCFKLTETTTDKSAKNHGMNNKATGIMLQEK